MSKNKKEKSKDKFFPKIAFGLSLGFWVPLFNFGLCIASLIIAVKSLKNIFREPDKYGGIYFAIIAIVLSVSSLVLTIIGLLIYLMSEQICESIICQQYYQGEGF